MPIGKHAQLLFKFVLTVCQAIKKHIVADISNVLGTSTQFLLPHFHLDIEVLTYTLRQLTTASNKI